jgi:hypothetical protein
MMTTPDKYEAAATRLAVPETHMTAVQEGQRQIITRLDSMDLRSDALNSPIGRLFCTILALGIAAIGAQIAWDKVL